MIKAILPCFVLSAVMGCTPVDTNTQASNDFVDLSKRDKPLSITQSPWEEVVVTAPDANELARLFIEIGGFEKEVLSNGLRLRAVGSDSGFIRIISPEGMSNQFIRPPESRSWDKGCYFSIMMRAKNLPSIIEDAKALGWEPFTSMAYLEFGPSKLNVVVLTHKSTGVRVQLYERLTTPLPEGFTEFERVSRPFNVMQMVDDRDASYDFFQQVLGFETFFYGPPYMSKKKEITPIGIPPELTTTTPYKTAIMLPFKGAEWGRVEMIDVENMPDGKDYSNRCDANNTGIHTLRFGVENLDETVQSLTKRGIATKATVSAKTITVKSPDGSNLEFFQP